MNKKPLIFVAMSGGVDSSAAAALLKKTGYEVIGVHMKCYNLDGCGEREAEDARHVAEILGIPFYVFDFEKEYKDRVVKYMVDGYKNGITPNPDVMCNREIKFGLFLKKALEMGANFVATGHYVLKIENCKLKIARDTNKDQSYFLWTLTQDQLKHCLFPIGEYTKPRVRAMARKFGLPTAEKKDSQGICFLGQVSLPDFLKQYIRPKAGAIMNDSGKVIGEHNGAHFYTIGQRHGLKIGGTARPLYVAEKDVKKNVIVVAEGDNHKALYKKEIVLTGINFISPQHSNILQNVGMLPVMARVRYRQPLAKAKLFLPNSREWWNNKTGKLIFAKPQKFVAAGQSAVFYTVGGEMLGGGIIV